MFLIEKQVHFVSHFQRMRHVSVTLLEGIPALLRLRLEKQSADAASTLQSPSQNAAVTDGEREREKTEAAEISGSAFNAPLLLM